MSSLSAWPVQKGLYSLLTSAGVAISDEVPTTGSTSFPYVSFGEFAVRHEGTHTNNVQVVSVNLDIWARYNGNKGIAQLADDVVTTVTENDLSVSGWTVAGIELQDQCYTNTPILEYDLRKGTVSIDITLTEE